jgi:hypothetical protein
MGVVYLAEQIRLRRQVALKLITPEFAEDQEFRQRFERESQLAASLDHPNIIPVHEAGEADGALFISMRYVEGSDLREMIRDHGRVEPERAVRLIAQVAGALDAAHGRGLVHRDVKPANILVGGAPGDERAYLTDFGLTKHVSSVSGLTHTGQWVGTLDYVAPEQVSGGPLDARVDIYSLGCVLFESLAGQVPYPRDSDVAKMYAHLHDPPPPISGVVPGIPPAFDAVIARALAKEPGDRFPSAGDLGRAAQAAVQGAQPAAPERSVATGKAAPGAQDRPDEPQPAADDRATTPRLPPRTPATFPGSGPAHSPNPPPRVKWPVLVVCGTALALGGMAAVLAATGAFSGGTARDARPPTVIVQTRVVGPQPTTPAAGTGGTGTGNSCTITHDRSMNADTAASITFVNNTTAPVTTYWLDYHGNRVKYTKLGPGQSYKQPTYVTHPWVATDAAGNCVGYTVADQPSQTYTIGG